MPFPDESSFVTYLTALPEGLHDAFILAVVGEDAGAGGARTVDYVRLSVTARRP